MLFSASLIFSTCHENMLTIRCRLGLLQRHQPSPYRDRMRGLPRPNYRWRGLRLQPHVLLRASRYLGKHFLRHRTRRHGYCIHRHLSLMALDVTVGSQAHFPRWLLHPGCLLVPHRYLGMRSRSHEESRHRVLLSHPMCCLARCIFYDRRAYCLHHRC